MERTVKVFNKAGDYAGYVLLSQDDRGRTVGEAYTNTGAEKTGAVRYEPFRYQAEESLIFSQEGDQLGYVRLERYEGGRLGGDIYWHGRPGTDAEVVAHIQFDPSSDEAAELKKKAEWGEKLGSIKPENVSPEELVLVGGGTAFLLLM